jgi:uncharacterized protein (TIGR00251 family)
VPVESVRVRIRVSPGASRDEIVGRHGDGWKVRVTAAPERGRANDAIVRLLSEALGVPRDAVAVVAGHASRDKLVEVSGLDEAAVDRGLSSAGAKR